MFRSRKDKNSEPQPRKLVVTGTWSSGKTCLLLRYCTDEYQYIDIPRAIENVKMNFSIFSGLITLDLWDKQLFRCDWDDGQRPLFYTGSSVVILCFGIDNPGSLLDVKEVWMPEVRLYTQAPILLVGCKMDIRTDTVVLEKMRTRYEDMEPVSVQQGRDMAKSIGASMYLECSANTGEGVDEVFHHAARLSLQAKTLL